MLPRTKTLALALLLASAALAGCAADETQDDPPATTSPATGTPTATPAATPAATPTATPTASPPPAGDDAPRARYLEAPPATAAPFSTVEVAWTIENAEGSTPHTAVHADTQPHADEASLSPATYPLSFYPGEGPYALPGEFRVAITMPADGALHLRPHAVVAGRHVWGEEATITVDGEAATGVALVRYPPAARAGVPFEVQWRVSAPDGSTTPHSAVHYGADAVDKAMADLRPSDYPRATQFQSGAVPATFTSTITPTEPGAVHFRAHVIVGGVHYWTEEVALSVNAPETPNVLVASAPSRVEPGATFEVQWRVNAPAAATTQHTAVHYGPESHADAAPETLAPSTYPEATAFHDGEVPATFEDTLTAPAEPGELFLRAHVILDGVHYWSDELRVSVAEA